MEVVNVKVNESESRNHMTYDINSDWVFSLLLP